MEKWWNTTERGAGQLSKRLIELAKIKPGSKVLDIATGIGEPAITAANKIGKTGHILATDISPGMSSVAKQRAISLGLQNVIKFKEGPFGLSDENSLKNSFITSGFKDPIIEKMNVSFDFESADDFTTFVLETAGPVQTILANQTFERREEILGAITEVAKNTLTVPEESSSIMKPYLLLIKNE